MCFFRLYDITPSHALNPEEYPRQGGRTARVNCGMTLGGLTFPQQEYHSQLHTTFSLSGYRRSRSARAATWYKPGARRRWRPDARICGGEVSRFAPTFAEPNYRIWISGSVRLGTR